MLESMLAGTHISLETHPKARSKCVATAPRAAGTVLLVVPALSTALLQAGKGRRCDNCHRLESDIMRLRKCTGCVSYWYCGRECADHVFSAWNDPVSQMISKQVSLCSGQRITSEYANIIPAIRHQRNTKHCQATIRLMRYFCHICWPKPFPMVYIRGRPARTAHLTCFWTC